MRGQFYPTFELLLRRPNGDLQPVFFRGSVILRRVP